jgi:hypothetical protein
MRPLVSAQHTAMDTQKVSRSDPLATPTPKMLSSHSIFDAIFPPLEQGSGMRTHW